MSKSSRLDSVFMRFQSSSGYKCIIQYCLNVLFEYFEVLKTLEIHRYWICWDLEQSKCRMYIYIYIIYWIAFSTAIRGVDREQLTAPELGSGPSVYFPIASHPWTNCVAGWFPALIRPHILSAVRVACCRFDMVYPVEDAKNVERLYLPGMLCEWQWWFCNGLYWGKDGKVSYSWQVLW